MLISAHTTKRELMQNLINSSVVLRNPHIIKSTLITLFSICYSQLINYNLDLVHLITFENASNN